VAMLPSLSDLILFCTLVVNGAAVLNFKMPSLELQPFGEAPEPSIQGKFVELLKSLRVLRVFVALWNILVIVLLVVIFGS